MRFLRKAIFAPVPLLLLVVAPHPQLSDDTHAQAQPFTESSGTFQVTSSEVIASQELGSISFFAIESTLEVTGTFTGTLECSELQIVRRSGAGQFFDTCTFTGEVNGQVGTAPTQVWGSFNSDGETRGRTTSGNGTGGLEELLAFGRIEGPGDGTGTYSGRVNLPGGVIED